MILTFALIFVALILIDLFTPHVIRKSTVFGISIPEPFIDDEQLAAFKKKYSIRIVTFQLPFVVLLLLVAYSFGEMGQSVLLIVGIFVYLIISLILYLRFHQAVKKYKATKGWEAQISVVRVSSFETKFEKKERPFPHMLFVPTLFITGGLAVWLMSIYPQLPESIPTHWGISGEPDAWNDKSFFSVFFIIFTLLFTQVLMYGLSYGIFHAAVQIKTQDAAYSLQREHEVRKLNAEVMALVNFATTLLLAMLLVQSNWNILYGDETLSMLFALPIFLALTFGSIYFYMKRNKVLNERFKATEDDTSSPSDDAYWKWGMFYFNKDNPDLFVEKKFGVGWTVNFARPGIWLFLFFILVIPLIPIFFM